LWFHVEKSICNSPGGALITLYFFVYEFTNHISARSTVECAELQRQRPRLLCQAFSW